LLFRQIKTCEPFFTVVIVYMFDGTLPGRTSTLALVTAVTGVLVASVAQRASAGKSHDFAVGISVAMLANLALQLRNVVNKRLMATDDGRSGTALILPSSDASPQSDASEASESVPSDPPPPPPPPFTLMLLTLAGALPLQLMLHAASDVASRLLALPPSASRYAHYADAPALWLLVPPLAFVTYQSASIFVLARVDPVMHIA